MILMKGIYLFVLLIFSTKAQDSFYIDNNEFNLKSINEESKNEEFHWCIYRNFPLLPNKIFEHYGGYGCYIYGVNSRFNENKLSIVSCFITWNAHNWTIPCGKTPSGNIILFTAKYEDQIASTFRSDTEMRKYRNCYFQASTCCNAMTNETTVDLNGHCPMTWDGWQCWESAPAGTIQQTLCQDHMYFEQGPSCQHFSSKTCFINGTWRTHTDLVGCDVTPRIQTRMVYHSIILGASILVCLPAIIIFISYKKLRVLRMALHRNLLVAIVLHNTFSIVIKTEIFFDAAQHTTDPDNESLLMQNGVPCRVLAFFEKLSGQAIYTMMLLEAIYLHRQIAAAFRVQPKAKWLYTLGLVMMSLPVIAWTISTALLQDHQCWIVQDNDVQLQWITDSFRILVLVINGILLIDIIRVLITKLSSIQSLAIKNTRKMVRIMLFLVPVFGLHFAVVSVRPNIEDCSGEQAYYYFANTIEGLQGAFVALLYCYFNKEVKNLLRITFIRLRMKIRNGASTISSNPESDGRRTTFTTVVDNNTTPRKSNQEQAPLSPKHHFTESENNKTSENYGFSFDQDNIRDLDLPLDNSILREQNSLSFLKEISNEISFLKEISNKMDPKEIETKDTDLNLNNENPESNINNSELNKIEFINGKIFLNSGQSSLDSQSEPTFVSNFNSNETTV